jgi:hypothetical protein
MSKTAALGTLGTYLEQSTGGPFLCAKGQRGYEPGYDMIDQLQRDVESGADEMDEDELIRRDLARWGDRENMGREMANSRWWHEARTRFGDDKRKWEAIRESMARGCCRVVLRVDESLSRRMAVPGAAVRATAGMGDEPWTVMDTDQCYGPDMRGLPGLAQTFAAAEASGARGEMGGG